VAVRTEAASLALERPEGLTSEQMKARLERQLIDYIALRSTRPGSPPLPRGVLSLIRSLLAAASIPALASSAPALSGGFDCRRSQAPSL